MVKNLSQNVLQLVMLLYEKNSRVWPLIYCGRIYTCERD